MKKESNIENLIEIKVETDVLNSVLEKDGLLKSEDINEGNPLQNQAVHIFDTIYFMMQENNNAKIDEGISQLSRYIKTFDINVLLKPSLFNRIFKKDSLISRYLKIEEEVNTKTYELEIHRIQLTKEITQLERLLEEMIILLQQFSSSMFTIKNKIESFQEDPVILHKKLEDLKLTQSILKQISLQIEMLLKTHCQLNDQISIIHSQIIPMWKKYVANTLKVNISLEESVHKKEEISVDSFDKINEILLSLIDNVLLLNEQGKKDCDHLMNTIK